MITKEQIKAEIDNINDEHLTILYKIIKALESPIEYPLKQVVPGRKGLRAKVVEWHGFIQNTYGCLADAPIDRGEQGL